MTMTARGILIIYGDLLIGSIQLVLAVFASSESNELSLH